MPSIAVFGEIENILGPEATSMAHTCILEFCITNEYITKQVTWNCINHLLTRHGNLFSSTEKEYLKALNNSHMSIYEVISTDKAKGVSVIHDQIESAAGKVEVFDKSLSKNTRPGQLIAVRLIKIHDKSGQEKYILSTDCEFYKS